MRLLLFLSSSYLTAPLLLWYGAGGSLSTVSGFGVADRSKHRGFLFVASPHGPRRSAQPFFLAAAATSSPSSPPPLLDVPVAATTAKANLLQVTQRLQDEYGLFVIDVRAKEELQKAVEDLEAITNPPGDEYGEEDYEKIFLGDWTLVCTTATPTTTTTGASFLGGNGGNALPLFKGLDTSKVPFFNASPWKDIRAALNKLLVVKQRIRSENGIDIDRVDHVLEYQPPETLQDIFNLPKEWSNLNINPLHVSQGKLTLVHQADVESINPLVTKLTLKSVVLSVAGTSQYLDPNGKDVLGINVPHLTDFLNSGSFETTYMDQDLRISRGKIGLVEQLRVFVRTKEPLSKEEKEAKEEPTSDTGIEATTTTATTTTPTTKEEGTTATADETPNSADDKPEEDLTEK